MAVSIGQQAKEALAQLVQAAGWEPGTLVVVGCSTSEVAGQPIGTASSLELAKELVSALEEEAAKSGIELAYQCCEHLNRALVVSGRRVQAAALTKVRAFPLPGAGGAVACAAMLFDPGRQLVEAVQADGGLDIGQTLIGMHIRPVATPVRLAQKMVGAAVLTAAFARPKLIGGDRAAHERPQELTW
ncbi:MAG: TIGR01440 family protein [Sulfobacillus sp.]